ncbi:membrane bound O-acyl transferase family protein [Heterostelium album PN500]|uniref:O-acyltransferase n=1 Tax=Heterostelium pallidum (strain ATCC 26659 / Pp 5 / PN500) TaxID=670386 RepID=D3BBP6_HETP5|nr:membrane bound O-acyl transferase family protein [Heterostelium album PN500]EFA81079.1 membrane bound O-acyl transferase family protein [Heterostelium album PN500]|eukprot:XP_020433197.1 membrane bound O-acyl transferase family protein [Heterostelium album PN500]
MVTTQVIEQETSAVSKLNSKIVVNEKESTKLKHGSSLQHSHHHQHQQQNQQNQQSQQHENIQSDKIDQPSENNKWTPYIVVEPTTYKRPFSISSAYLDLEDRPGTIPSAHKLIHKNRILLLTLTLLYVILSEPDRFVRHLDLLNVIFVNPLLVLPELTVMHSFSMLLPIVTAIYAKKKISRKLYVAMYIILQVASSSYSALFVLSNEFLPIGTSLFLSMELILITWKNHSYFIVRNYYDFHNIPEPESVKKEAYHLKSVFWYIGDFYSLFGVTYIDLRSISRELYSSFCILVVVHFLNVQIIIPNLYKPPSIKTFATILIPAEINFQLQYYLLYHCVFSLLADISGFRDRFSFYEDYWAAIEVKEILSKWSKPVHSWLFRHVHNDLRSLFGFSKWASLFLTMLFSGFFHEFIIMVTSRNICFPWSTANLIGCGWLIWMETTVKGLATSTPYRLLMRVLLLLGHGAFYFAIYHLCYSKESF